MPIFEYLCMKCDHKFEMYEPRYDEKGLKDYKKCPKCGAFAGAHVVESVPARRNPDLGIQT